MPRRTLTNAPRYHLTHAQLAAEVRAMNRRDARRSRLVGSFMLGATFAALLAFGVRASEFVALPIAGPEMAADGFPWLTAISGTILAAVALWAVLSGFRDTDEAEPIDYRDAESRGGRADV